MPTHTIRLREPWQSALVEGGTRFSRRFNCPTNLDPDERVWLVVEGACYRGSITLNDTLLGESGGSAELAEFDVTGLLADYNLVVIDAEIPAANPEAARADSLRRLPGEVRLEIRS